MKTSCSEFEVRLESFLRGALGSAETRACELHLRECGACAELVEIATVPEPRASERGTGLTEAVLERTSGRPCASAESALVARLDGELASSELLDLHLGHCQACRALDRVLTVLERQLPSMAELVPGPGFVRRVLAASLPWPIRLRRWWRDSWPAWVRRPRFALEAAYALTLVFLLLFNLPGAPLAAMPSQALDLARGTSLAALEEPVRQRLAVWNDTFGRHQLEAVVARQTERPRAGWQKVRQQTAEIVTDSRARARTFLAALASWWMNATEDSASRQSQPTEETP